MATECVNKKKNEKDCPCSSKDCDYHGICCECIANHRASDSKPACMR